MILQTPREYSGWLNKLNRTQGGTEGGGAGDVLVSIPAGRRVGSPLGHLEQAVTGESSRGSGFE